MKDKMAKTKEKQKEENAEQQNEQGKPGRPSADCVVLCGSADRLLFDNCIIPRPDGKVLFVGCSWPQNLAITHFQ
jgi:hypothetical protein